MVGIPGGVIGWMVSWGVWPLPHVSYPEPHQYWLPSSTGKFLHSVIIDYDRDPSPYSASCRNGSRHIELLPKFPLSPGDQNERFDNPEADGCFNLWQQVASAYIAWNSYTYNAVDPAHIEAIRVVHYGLDRIRWVHEGSAFLDILTDHAPMFPNLPSEAIAPLPWLVTGAANGLLGLCRRCTSSTPPFTSSDPVR